MLRDQPASLLEVLQLFFPTKKNHLLVKTLKQNWNINLDLTKSCFNKLCPEVLKDENGRIEDAILLTLNQFGTVLSLSTPQPKPPLSLELSTVYVEVGLLTIFTVNSIPLHVSIHFINVQ